MRVSLKIIVFLVLLILTAVLLTGCKKITPEDVLKEIKQRFEKIEDIHVKVKTFYYDGKETHVYETKQYFKKPNLFRIEAVSPEMLKGKITIYDGQRFIFLNKKIGDGFELNNTGNPKQNLTSISEIFNEIEKKLDSIHFNTETKDDKKYYTIEYIIDKNNPFIYKKKIWVNSKTFLPEFVNVFRKGGKPYMNIEYIDMKINQGLDDELFKVDYGRL